MVTSLPGAVEKRESHTDLRGTQRPHSQPSLCTLAPAGLWPRSLRNVRFFACLNLPMDAFDIMAPGRPLVRHPEPSPTRPLF